MGFRRVDVNAQARVPRTTDGFHPLMLGEVVQKRAERIRVAASLQIGGHVLQGRRREGVACRARPPGLVAGGPVREAPHNPVVVRSKTLVCRRWWAGPSS